MTRLLHVLILVFSLLWVSSHLHAEPLILEQDNAEASGTDPSDLAEKSADVIDSDLVPPLPLDKNTANSDAMISPCLLSIKIQTQQRAEIIAATKGNSDESSRMTVKPFDTKLAKEVCEFYGKPKPKMPVPPLKPNRPNSFNRNLWRYYTSVRPEYNGQMVIYAKEMADYKQDLKKWTTREGILAKALPFLMTMHGPLQGEVDRVVEEYIEIHRRYLRLTGNDGLAESTEVSEESNKDSTSNSDTRTDIDQATETEALESELQADLKSEPAIETEHEVINTAYYMALQENVILKIRYAYLSLFLRKSYAHLEILTQSDFDIEVLLSDIQVLETSEKTLHNEIETEALISHFEAAVEKVMEYPIYRLAFEQKLLLNKAALATRALLATDATQQRAHTIASRAFIYDQAIKPLIPTSFSPSQIIPYLSDGTRKQVKILTDSWNLAGSQSDAYQADCDALTNTLDQEVADSMALLERFRESYCRVLQTRGYHSKVLCE